MRYTQSEKMEIIRIVEESELEQDTQGVVIGNVWILDIATQQSNPLTNQALPLGSVFSNDLFVWTKQGLIVNRLLDDGTAALFSEDNVTLLPSNAITASPSGTYVIYEDGRVEQANDGAQTSQLAVCDDIKGQNFRVIWSHSASNFAYTVDCAATADTYLGVFSLVNPDLSWTLSIPNHFRLIGWSHDDNYLLFRNQINGEQIDYTIERLAVDPNAVLETIAGSMFLLDVLDQDPEGLKP